MFKYVYNITQGNSSIDFYDLSGNKGKLDNNYDSKNNKLKSIILSEIQRVWGENCTDTHNNTNKIILDLKSSIVTFMNDRSLAKHIIHNYVELIENKYFYNILLRNISVGSSYRRKIRYY